MEKLTIRKNHTPKLSGFLSRELNWVSEIVARSYMLFFKLREDGDPIFSILPPSPLGASGFYADFIRQKQPSFEERFVIALSLVPHLDPAIMDPLLLKNPDIDQHFTEFGGVRKGDGHPFFPTMLTALFILDSGDLERRAELVTLFDEEHFFAREGILSLGHVSADEPRINAQLNISPDFLDQVLAGRPRTPRFGMAFPAKAISTKLEWEDLVLEHNVVEEISDLLAWLEHHQKLEEEWGLARMIKPGYRALFYGPPGTGKTLTATLLGKQTGKPVFRIDLSMVVSKFIGETEKNLGRVFSAAENKDWILFFDEADALFGKRTKVSDSHDRYANQEVSYLLQRVEEYSGLVILATNLKSNMDEAFYRRFQSIVHFPVPGPEQRFRLWKNSFSEKTQFAPDVDLRQIAAKYELSGGAIINIVQYCSLMMLKNGADAIFQRDIIAGIRKEFMKEGKTV